MRYEKKPGDYRCPHNEAVVCNASKSGKCALCGWNPIVANERAEIFRQKRKEVPCNG